MRRDTTASGENAFSGDHAAEIFGRGLDANEEDFFALLGSDDGAVGVEIDLAGGGAWAGGETRGDDGRFLGVSEVEDRREELFELVGGVAHDRSFPADELFLHHIDGELERGGGGALAVARLEHEQLAFLDREFDVLHVLEMFLERGANFHEFGVGFGHLVLQLEDGLGGAHAGDDVFALSVEEKFAVEFVDSVGGIAGERDAGAGGLTGVAIYHGLDVDGGAPLGGDAVFGAVNLSAIIHPRTEDGTGGAAELVPRIIWEGFSGAVFDEGLEALDEFLLVGGGQLAVDDVAVIGLVLECVDHGLERIVVFAFAFLDADDDVAIHLDEAAVAVPGEALVFGRGDQGEDGLVVETEIENGVHHAGHRVAGTRADGDEEGEAGGIAKLVAHDLLHVLHAGFHLGLQRGRIGALVGVVIGADLGRDREAGRHGEPDASHLGEVGALAAEEVLHRTVTIGAVGAPRVNVLERLRSGSFLGSGGGGLRGGFLGGGFGGHIGWVIWAEKRTFGAYAEGQRQ